MLTSTRIVAIIGRAAKNVQASDAASFLLGYTLANDVSARSLQFAVSQATFGKSFDTFLPLGPVIINANAFTSEPVFHLRTELNGQTVQSSSTREMIYSISELVEKLSRGTTLAPGTLILTGTPEGIGFRRDPRVWLKHGDVVVVEGSGGLGSLYSHVVYED
jgi:2-keto-4-pentenoate hydratase/2-oxohepta-3-ene-1,7-dioic acid hydratase in catechol pathway